MTGLSDRDFLRFRLFAHGLLGDHASTIEAVAERMLAIQAQDYAQAGWALAVRTAGTNAHDVANAFTSRALVRSWPMRGTLHIVPAHDLNWMLQLTTSRMLARTATRRRQLELDDGTIERARDVAIRALAGGNALPRSGLLSEFDNAGIATDGQRGYHLIYHLAQTGTLVWGPPAANQQAIVLSDEWIEKQTKREPDAALEAFLLGYLSGHGPATLKDFAWWSGLTLAQAKAGRAVAGSALIDVEMAGTTYLMPRELPDAAPQLPASHVRALPGFDEYFLGYQDRSSVIEPEFAPRIVPGGNGVFKPTIISKGRVIGTWRRAGPKPMRQLEPEPFTTMSQSEQSAFRASAKRFARYLQSPNQ